MYKKTVDAEVRTVLNNVFSYRHDNWVEFPGEEALTGVKGRLSASEMVFLVREMEDHFGVRFSAEALANYGLLTINGIVTQLEAVSEK